MRTFGSTLDTANGFGHGFDFIRIALAISILAFHSIVVAGDVSTIDGTALWLPVYALVPMFFGLSGFLVAGSGLRLSLSNFLLNRGLRIVPALAVEISMSALIIGPIFTTFALPVYFADKDFYEYFLNIVGYIQYDLPGVFLENRSHGIVNQSLWTIPYEILCYAVMSVFIWRGLLKKPHLIAAGLVVYICLPVIIELLGLTSDLPKLATSIFFGRGTLALQCFVLGCLVYIYRHRIPFSPAAVAVSIAVCLVMSMLDGTMWRGSAAANLLLCAPLTYITIYVGLCRIPPVPFYSTGDYSYGVYLYGYPIQQSLVALFPNQSVMANFIGSLILVTGFAVTSWHMIEKPILKMRKKFSFIGRRIDEAEPVAPKAQQA